MSGNKNYVNQLVEKSANNLLDRRRTQKSTKRSASLRLFCESENSASDYFGSLFFWAATFWRWRPKFLPVGSVILLRFYKLQVRLQSTVFVFPNPAGFAHNSNKPSFFHGICPRG
jgi:hypothetical protein